MILLVALGTFLLGILFLLVVLWAVDLVLAKLTLPDGVAQVAKAIIGLFVLCLLLWLVMGAFGVGGAPKLFPW
jgi:hypothetical protein